MSRTREETARAPLETLGLVWRFASICRYWLRRMFYASGPLRRAFEPNAIDDAAQHWDSALSRTNLSTYLGQTVSVDCSNLMAATLIKFGAKDRPAVLDVGCCGGTLAIHLTSSSRYLGIDVSRFAVETARSDPLLSDLISSGRADFKAVDLRDYRPESLWDVIVFNEVLYYFKVDEAVRLVRRYEEALATRGVLVVSMKDDAKSHVIFKSLLKHFHWLDGVLYQRKPVRAGYRTNISFEYPSFLIGVMAIK